ncbi:MAG: fumarylacetoacetate hydrolase family protein, partial [Burkholderiales bacterium]
RGDKHLKLIRFRTPAGVALGCVAGSGVVDLTRRDPALQDMAALLTQEGRALAAKLGAGASPDHRLEDVTLMTPLAAGARLFCIGLNYKSHVAETGREMPPQPSVFLRTHESVVAHGEPVRKPPVSDHFDFEGELSVVIGRPASRIAEADALACIGGYTIVNDGSLRDFQKHSVTAGKNFDSSGACGPWIVTADEIPDPTQLTLVTRLNGAEVQRSTTDLLIYSIPRILSYISSFAALKPGDVIATGTPAGVGARRTPPLWMKPGDTIEVDISGVGVLRNPVAA